MYIARLSTHLPTAHLSPGPAEEVDGAPAAQEGRGGDEKEGTGGEEAPRG